MTSVNYEAGLPWVNKLKEVIGAPVANSKIVIHFGSCLAPAMKCSLFTFSVSFPKDILFF